MRWSRVADATTVSGSGDGDGSESNCSSRGSACVGSRSLDHWSVTRSSCFRARTLVDSYATIGCTITEVQPPSITMIPKLAIPLPPFLFPTPTAKPMARVRWCLFAWTSIEIVLLTSMPVDSYDWSLSDLSSVSTQSGQNVVSQGNTDFEGNRVSRVLNFFPVPVEVECLSQDKRRSGICMNTYECRIQRGKSHGSCALGFGVCCIFTVSCDEEIQNNLTYVTSPGFPNLIDWPMNCSLLLRKVDRQVSQLRIDFVHFNIGQPNIRTGVCDGDIMEIISGSRTFQMCGWNSGQHLYIDMDEEDAPVTLNFRLPRGLEARMWEMRVVQLGFEQRAPTGCLQYFRSPNGTLRSFNYLPNGRFLANQDYLICTRQERGMCGIAYNPCTTESFRIGRPAPQNVSSTPNSNAAANNPGNSSMQITNAPTTSNNTNSDDALEGSGSGPEQDTPVASNAPASSNLVRRCRDRVLIPCDFEEFITPGNEGAGICNLEHCGSSLCDRNELDEEGNCRVETWATPFRIRVAFGPGLDTGTTLEDNVGMCLQYEQLPCVV